MVTRDFDAMLADKAGVRPTFRLAGQEFTVKARLPHKKFRSLLTQLSDETLDDEKGEEEFLRMAIIPKDRERFFELLEFDGEGDEVDDSSVVGPEQVSKLIEWLMELYTGKLSASSDSSSAGSEKTGVQRKVVSLSSRNQAG